MRRAIKLAAAICIVLIPALSSAQEYVVRRIRTPELGGSYASAINNHLQVAGANQSQAFLWSVQGGPLVLVPGSYQSSATAINDVGEVVGEARFPGGQDYHAFLWTQTSGVQDLGTLGGTGSWATGINASGQVVGYAKLPNDVLHAFLWTQTGGMQDLGTLDGDTYSGATAINDKGQVVGFSEGSTGILNSHGFLWSQTRGMRKLPGLPSGDPITPTGINDEGQIAGYVSLNVLQSIRHVVFWPHLLSGGVQDLGTLPGGVTSTADSIDENGEIVGRSAIDTNVDFSHGFRWTRDSGMQDVNNLIPPDSGWTVIECFAANAEGKIVGDAIVTGKNPGNIHAFLMIPQVSAK